MKGSGQGRGGGRPTLERLKATLNREVPPICTECNQLFLRTLIKQEVCSDCRQTWWAKVKSRAVK